VDGDDDGQPAAVAPPDHHLFVVENHAVTLTIDG
jgi:hypothetical protein